MRWIIGDIHGMLLPLQKLLDEIAKRDPKPKFMFCGDYVNRGPDSRGVVDLLLSLPDALFCRGNHDDTFNLLMTGRSFVPLLQVDVVTTFEHFLQYGLDQTLYSYGIDQDALAKAARWPSPTVIRELLAPVPDAHRDFFDNLPGALHEPDFFVAHARWNPLVATDPRFFDNELRHSPQARHDIIWGRFTSRELLQSKRWDRPGFFGHTPVTMYRTTSPLLPVEADKVFLLDTGAAVNDEGRLTAWCFEESNYVQVERDGTLAL